MKNTYYLYHFEAKTDDGITGEILTKCHFKHSWVVPEQQDVPVYVGSSDCNQICPYNAAEFPVATKQGDGAVLCKRLRKERFVKYVK